MKLPDTIEGCVALRTQIEAAHKQTGSFYLIDKPGRAKLDKVDRHITHLLAEKRAAAGRPVACDGYSGRQTNRR